MNYSFRHTDGTITKVSAPEEKEARAAAMLSKHGPPKPLNSPIPNKSPARHFVIGSGGYVGYGLSPESIE